MSKDHLILQGPNGGMKPHRLMPVRDSIDTEKSETSFHSLGGK
jgi:hypothetical protein